MEKYSQNRIKWILEGKKQASEAKEKQMTLHLLMLFL
jgi:hypothetical protein